jgi:hypothetical protein
VDVCRLRHNVIKTGVRMISVSYARISLADLATKLHLASVEDAEYIAAKARAAVPPPLQCPDVLICARAAHRRSVMG